MSNFQNDSCCSLGLLFPDRLGHVVRRSLRNFDTVVLGRRRLLLLRWLLVESEIDIVTECRWCFEEEFRFGILFAGAID